MEQKLKEKCDLLSENRDTIEDAFIWDAGMLTPAVATIFTAAGEQAEKEKLRETAKVLQEETGLFSALRGNLKVPIICKMALADDPKEYVDKIKKTYEYLTKNHLFGNEYQLLAATILSDYTNAENLEEAAGKMSELFEKMKKKQKLSDEAGYPLAAMLAIRGIDPDALTEKSVAITELLKKKKHTGKMAQMAANILSLGDASPEDACERFCAIYDKLKEQKHPLGDSYGLPVVAALTKLDLPDDQIVQMIADADDYLREKKGFGNLMLGAEFRRLFAAQMLLDSYGGSEDDTRDMLMSGMLGYQILVEIALMAAVSASLASATFH